MSATPPAGSKPAIQQPLLPPPVGVVVPSTAAANRPGSPLAAPANNTMRSRFARLWNTKKVPNQPARRFDADWRTAAGEICQGWVDAQAGHNVTTVSHVALSRMKALEYERKNLVTIHPDQRLLPATATTDDYYRASIEAFLAAVGEKDPQAVLESFKLAGTGGLHRQHATVGATISNALSVAIVLAPDPATRLALVGARLLTQTGTSAAVIASGPRRFRNACTEDVMPLGRADAAPAAKRAPNMLQASLGVMRTLKMKAVNKSVQEMHDAMQALDRARDDGPVKARQETRQQLELAFARICHQLSVKASYKTASESAKIEFIGNLRYLLSSYTGTAAVLTAAMIGIMTPLFIDAVVTGGLIGAATALTALMYLGYQLSTGPARDGEEKAKRAIVALVKMLEVLGGENTESTRQRGAAYADYLQERKVPRFTRAAGRKKIREAALARLQDRLAAISSGEPLSAGLDLASNWANYSRHLKGTRAIDASAAQDKLAPAERQQRLTDHDKQFRDRHQKDLAIKELVAAWKTPMQIRMDAASRLVKGKVAQSYKRLLALRRGETAGTGHGRAGQTDQSKRAIETQKKELRDRLLDLFHLELALQDLKLAPGASANRFKVARARERIEAINDTDVRQLFCGSAEDQVEAIRLSKELTAGESERYTYANIGSAAIGIALNIGVPMADVVVNVGKATKAYATLQANDYKLVAVSQAGAQPAAHQSAGDRAAAQQRDIQPSLEETELKEPAPEHHLQLALEGNVLQPNDEAVKLALKGLMDDLGKVDVVPRGLHLILQHPAPDAAGASTSAAAPAPQEIEELRINLKPTTAFHRVQYKKNPFRQRMRHIRHQWAIIGRQAAMSIAGLPVQAFVQRRLKRTRAPLNSAAESVAAIRARLQPTTFDPQEVPVNASGLRCRENAHVVMVQAGAKDQAPHPIHAHKIAQQLRSEAAYAAGQSPPDGSVDGFLLQGLASGQGIFQFVSQRAHFQPEHSRETPVIKMLLEQLGQQQLDQPEGRVIGGRYRVISFDPIGGGGDSDFLRYKLVATDTWSTPPQEVEVPITQVGLKFSGRLLCVREIRRASALLDGHNALLAQPANPANADKMILSFAGIGRNATLITYRVLRDAIDDKLVTQDSLDAAIDAEISGNRIRRGPGYVHTEEQKDALRTALLARIKDREEQAARASASQV